MDNENNNQPQYTQEELEKLAEEYRGYPNKKGRPPKAIAKQIAAINRQKLKVKIQDGKTKVIIPKKDDRLEAFMEEFIKNGGNATQAVLAISKTNNIQSAASMGNRYLKEAKMLGRISMEKRGFHYGKMLDVATEKMMTSKTPEWWDRLMRISGYEGFEQEKKVAPANINIIGTVKNDAQEFGFEEAEVVEDETEKV